MPPKAIYEHSGPAELVLEGENLTPETLKLYHNGVLYTPLESSDTYAYYLLGDNGTNKMMLNGKNYCTVIVKDVVVPSVLPARLSLRQKSDNRTIGESSTSINIVDIASGDCINYPYLINPNYPYFLLFVHIEETDENDWRVENCTINNSDFVNKPNRLNVSVVDPTKPAYITYQGFIIAVFNYSA